MRFPPSFRRRLQLLKLPGARLLPPFQRTPVLRRLVAPGPAVIAAPAGLDELHPGTGVMRLASGEPSPLRATVDVAISTAALDLFCTQTRTSSGNVIGSLRLGLSMNGRAALGTSAASVFALPDAPAGAANLKSTSCRKFFATSTSRPPAGLRISFL